MLNNPSHALRAFALFLFPFVLLIVAPCQNDALAQEMKNTAQKVTCPVLNRESLRAKLAPEKSIKIIFFSTWCADCTSHLRELARLSLSAESENALAIAVFDTQEKVEKTLTRMNLFIPCAMDDGLAKELGVTVVPAERNIGVSQLQGQK